MSADQSVAPAPVFRLAAGALRGVAAEMLLLPTGLVTAAVVARALGPGDYGLFSLAASFVGWLALTTTSLLSRAAVKFVSETEQWEPVAASVLRWRLGIGGVATAVVAVSAGAIAHLLGERALAPYLRVFAIDLLLLNVVRTYRDVLTGTGHFRAVAALSALRWTARMFLLVILVSITHTVMAAVAGSIATTLLELLVASRLQPLTLRGPPGLAASRLWGVAGPLLVFSAALQLETKVDLFALSALGGSTTDVGYYSAAQNLAVLPSLFALGFAPLLLATLSRLERGAHHHEACVVARASLRVCLALIPLAAIVAGASGEIVRVIFGSAFIGAAPLLALLFAATVALATTAVSVSIVTVSAQPSRVSLLGVLLLGSALTGHALLIPRMGPQGAALATAASATLSACASLAIVHHTWRIHAYGTAIRATIAAVPLYWAASVIQTTTWFALVLKLGLLSLVGMSALLLLGELEAEDKQRVWALLHPTTSA